MILNTICFKCTQYLISQKGEVAMQKKTCCVTGHRNIPDAQRPYVESELRREVCQAIQDGYTRFISGFAAGADLIFADIVAEQKKLHPEISLEAALPHAARVNTHDARFHELLSMCDAVKVECEKYAPYCFDRRNRYMVRQSQRVIAVFDGRRTGGTALTLRYAQKLDREIRMVHIRADSAGG
ncbi:MAG TPA: DUF1273 family protein [Candidatus Fimadaptatus faecigallinarum]|uniref:DUF1273 family protein n=1 Tax=Candidatus Fimadaptatus faecigallinarum TaxID=2840814 RepID=A0A9D1LRP0_9FIRM|nr:DUF1273 family protein [Candidatus Fimadaptatus faecigallinarum]